MYIARHELSTLSLFEYILLLSLLAEQQNTPFEMGLAVGLVTFLMQLTRTVHAPAGANPLLILMTGHIGKQRK